MIEMEILLGMIMIYEGNWVVTKIRTQMMTIKMGTKMMMMILMMMVMVMVIMMMEMMMIVIMTKTAATRSARPPASLKYCAVE